MQLELCCTRLSASRFLSFMRGLCSSFILCKMRWFLVLLLSVNFLLPWCLLLPQCHQKYLAHADYRSGFCASRAELLDWFVLFHHVLVLWVLLFQREHLCVYLGFTRNALLSLSTSTGLKLAMWDFINWKEAWFMQVFVICLVYTPYSMKSLWSG